MLKIYPDSLEAFRSIFRRRSWEHFELTAGARQLIADTFGRPMTLEEVVLTILNEVRTRGDLAVRDLTRRIDGVEVGTLSVGRREMYQAYRRLPGDLQGSLELAALRVHAFHLLQMKNGIKSFINRGVGQKVTALDRAGIYVPGGTAKYPSTILMTAIPAHVAGVREIVVATPPGKDGSLSDVVMAAAYLSRVDQIFKVGGAQAIAAMAFGTKSIPKVDKICGPGNVFVVLAKKMVFGYTGIDSLAGPTETVIVADDAANPALCAADMVAQAEHDALASAILLTDSNTLAGKVQGEVEKLLADLDRSDIARASLEERGGIVIVGSFREATDLINIYAPEHVSIMVQSPNAVARRIRNAGCLFIGESSAEALGDYVAGPSHVLPTGGSARFTSALGVNDFLKVTGLVRLSEGAVKKLIPAATRMATAEGLTGHARAAAARLRPIKD